MNVPIQSLFWQRSQLNRALVMLARSSGLKNHVPVTSAPKAGTLNEWFAETGAALGLDAEPISFRYGELEQRLTKTLPAIIEYASEAEETFLVIARCRWDKLVLLAPDGSSHFVSPRGLSAFLRKGCEKSAGVELGSLLAKANIAAAKRDKTVNALLKERLSAELISKGWQLRLHPGMSFWNQLPRPQILPLLAGFGVSYIAMYGLFLLFWVALGYTLGGNVTQWQVAIVLGILVALVPFRLGSPWLFGMVSIRVAELLKRRLLYGALRMEPEEIRHQGTGQLLGRVIEAEAIESFALDGSGLLFFGLVELVMTIPLFVLGAGGWLHVLALVGWTTLTFVIAWFYFKARSSWTDKRLALTHDLVEHMIGYRTRLAQQPPSEWHKQEQALMNEYKKAAVRMDRQYAFLKAVIPRGWTLLGFVILIPALVVPTYFAQIALGIGAVVLVFRSFQMVADGLIQLSSAAVICDQVALMFNSATRPLPSARNGRGKDEGASDDAVLMQAENLGFRYNAHTDAVIEECNLTIEKGDRILLQGPSGSGKSTLGALLAGLRSPQQGSLRLNGIPQAVWGNRGWRKRIVNAPQFHENHVLTETFAFNLLMGRRWLPTQQDLEEAEQVCRELGLGDLLDRMPGGLFQVIGETGWQLSHGEKSRLYIARALLQGADLIILDESFAALDPDNLRRSLECVLERAPTLLVVAHP